MSATMHKKSLFEPATEVHAVSDVNFELYEGRPGTGGRKRLWQVHHSRALMSMLDFEGSIRSAGATSGD